MLSLHTHTSNKGTAIHTVQGMQATEPEQLQHTPDWIRNVNYRQIQDGLLDFSQRWTVKCLQNIFNGYHKINYVLYICESVMIVAVEEVWNREQRKQHSQVLGQWGEFKKQFQTFRKPNVFIHWRITQEENLAGKIYQISLKLHPKNKKKYYCNLVSEEHGCFESRVLLRL